MEPGQARIRKRHWRRDATNRCCICAGWFGCNGVIRFTVVEQDVPPLLQVGIMRTLQASLDLPDDSDKVIFRQFGGESTLRTQSGHTAIRADQFDSDGWQRPGITELCQNNDEGCATNYISVITQVYQRPRCMDDDTPAGDHDQHPHAVADHGRRQHRTVRDLRDLIPEIFPRHHLGSSPRFKCGKTNARCFSKP